MICEIGGRRPEVDPTAWVAESAVVVGSVRVLAEASVWFGAVVRADNDLITIGRRSNVQDGCMLHTDEGIRLTVGEDVIVGHAAALHGCTLEDGCLVGIGAIVLNHAKIGAGSILGAGALVPRGRVIPPGVLAFGRPARVVRQLTPAERAELVDGAQHYVDKARLYRASLRALPSGA